MEITTGRKTEKEVVDYLAVHGCVPFNVQPVAIVSTGPLVWNTGNEDANKNYFGLHAMDPRDCFDHPDWRPRVQTIRKRFNDELVEVPFGQAGGDIYLDSFELWKIMTLYTKGSFVAYEMLYQPSSCSLEEVENLFSLMRQGVTSRIGRTARDYVLHIWSKQRTNHKKSVMAFYRMMQALTFLHNKEFIWDMLELSEYVLDAELLSIPFMDQMAENILPANLKDDNRIESTKQQLAFLVDKVENAWISTELPDQVPQEVLLAIREKVKSARSVMISGKE